MQANPLPTIPYAQAGPVSTRLLEELIPHARMLRTNPEALGFGAGELLVMIYEGALQELVRRRRAMEVISDMADLDNVVFLAPGDQTHG